MPSKKHLRKRIGLLTATVEQLLIDNAAYATRLAEEGRGRQLAEVRAREAQNRLDAARARVAQADRAMIVAAHAVCERLLAGAGHDAVGTTEDGAS